MDWSRAKTILIVFLFAVNIFLFGTYMKKESDDRDDRLEQRREVVAVLARQGIFVSEESVPYEKVEISHASVRLPEDKGALASAVLGEVQETVYAENTVYSAENGNMMFSGESFSIVCETGEDVRSVEDAKAFAEDIADKLCLSHSGGEISTEIVAGGYKVRIPQILGGVRIFGADVEFNISGSGNVLANGRFIGQGKLIRSDGDTMEVPALLLEFADEIKESGKEKVEITGLDYGYMPRTPAGGRVYLVPTLEISTPSGGYYINMSDGSMTAV